MKRVYVGVVQATGRVLERCGLLRLMERWGQRHRWILWIRSWFAVYDLQQMLRVGYPWWTFTAADIVEKHLRTHPGARVLEWGSGVSTVWLAQRSAQVTSIEHDAEWARSMESVLPQNATVVAVEPLPMPVPVVGSSKSGFEGLDFSDYVAAAPRFDDVDVVVVDGRAREACIDAAMKGLRPGALLIVDNVDRLRYREALQRHQQSLDIVWTRGLTPSLPYPTRTAVATVRDASA